jgi:hypothetical protein
MRHGIPREVTHTLSPQRPLFHRNDTSLTYTLLTFCSQFLHRALYLSLVLDWSTHSRVPLRDSRLSTPPPPPSLDDIYPKQVAWNAFLADYTPSNHLSTVACTLPADNTLPPAISAATAFRNRSISSTVFCLITRHCFDADYSDCFCPSANDNMLCPCVESVPYNHTQPQALPCHTCHHVLFHCHLHRDAHTKHLQGLTSLPTIFRSEDHMYRLCTFLAETNSSLLCPLPVICPGHDPPH